MSKALLVIDFINDICHPDGKIPSSAAHTQEQNAIDNANKALAFARKQGWLTVQVKVGFEQNYHAQPKESPIFGKANQFEALKLGSFGTDFHEDLDVQPSDFIIEKPRVNPFYGTNLEPVLRANKVDELYVCGVSTAWAIQAVTRDAHDRDYKVTIIEDACAAADQQEHMTSIDMLSRIANIVKVDDLV
ncbi:isochorismatase family cysteine hydrolase [Vibrio marisflavi]|uniref:Isochorismatase family protein YecD n=1 Tax=Vibrio marisflavi CECT 7928 TaxID=634439 RepID=A0ABM9A2R5_9VIBR|nr:isochorismatase family cysteine hydrolase [Vibrio marisflavi]CAH0537661.1 Isochorismatase family protein YecD [Vibrio marisflavi CECT 7928]